MLALDLTVSSSDTFDDDYYLLVLLLSSHMKYCFITGNVYTWAR